MDNTSIINTKNIFLTRCKVFLEGVEVPYTSANVSYGISSPPSCTIALPASNILRDLPEDTKILVIYQNPQDPIDAEWKVLFDGELETISYSTTPNESTMLLQGLHATTYLDLLQLLVCEAASLLYYEKASLGNTSIMVPTVAGNNAGDVVLGNCIYTNPGDDNDRATPCKNMAEIVYTLIAHILDKERLDIGKGSEYTEFFYNKIIEQYALAKRIFGIGKDIDSRISSLLSSFKDKIQ